MPAIRTKPFKSVQPLSVQAAGQKEGYRGWEEKSRRERGREKEGTHSRKLLDASHKHLAPSPTGTQGNGLPVVS